MRKIPQSKSESRYFATAARMDDAFLALLEKKDFAYITVKEICAAAGVNRSTFYLHYETLGDLLAEAVERMVGQFVEYMEKDPGKEIARLRTCPREELYLVTPEYLVPYLNYVKENQRLFSTKLRNAGTLGLGASYQDLLKHVIGPILDRFGVAEKDRPYLMAFYMKGLMAIVEQWLADGCGDSIEHVMSMIQTCVQAPGE